MPKILRQGRCTHTAILAFGKNNRECKMEVPPYAPKLYSGAKEAHKGGEWAVLLSHYFIDLNLTSCSDNSGRKKMRDK